MSKPIPVEYEDNANTMLRLASRKMAGEREPITTSPSFYSDLFEFSYEAVGALDPRHEIVTDWTEQNRLAAIYLPQRDAGSGRALMEHLEGGKCSPGADCRGLVR
jgi:3-phenylpropionate/trans-cinnamate dioxygenase ferredoxin reductase component